MRPALVREADAPAEALVIADMVKAATTGQLLQVLFGEDAPLAFDSVGSLRALVAAPPTTLDLACQTRLGAFRELVARLIAEPRPRGQRVSGPEDAARLCGHLALLDHEEFFVIHLDLKHLVLAVERAGVGSAWQVEVAPADIFRPALARSSAAIVLVHCHPSGDPMPSQADRDLTRRMTEAATLLGIQVVDHIVIGAARRAYSFARQGIVTFDG